MTEQPTALWLADWLDVRACGGDNWNAKMNAAAAELRRLVTQRDALLEAVKLIVEFVDAPTEGKRPDVFVMRISKARAAIKKAEENT
jgi:hypothetical protein